MTRASFPFEPVRWLVMCACAVSLAGCFHPPRDMPDTSVLTLRGNTVMPPDCERLSRASVAIDAGHVRPRMEWGCATYTNLAAQIANPRDLVAPQPLGPADAAMAASAVRRYETGKLTPLDPTTSRDAK